MTSSHKIFPTTSRMLRATFVLLLIIGPSSTQFPAEPLSRDTNIVVFWNGILLKAISDTRTAPTVAARALAIVHTSVFDAWAAYDDQARPTRCNEVLRRPNSERSITNKTTAITYAAYLSLVDLFPSDRSEFETAMQELGVNPNDVSTDPTRADGIGNICAADVLADRHHDGSNQLGDLHPGAYSDYTGYQPLNGPDAVDNPDHWQPLRVPDGNGGFVVQHYVTPQWGEVIPFALSSGAEMRSARGPARYEGGKHGNYVQQADELIDLSAGLTDIQKVIAEYWALGPGSVTPPGRWFEFAQFVSERDHHSLDDDVKLFFILGNAMLDASIACWDDKRAFDSERPITAIRYLYAGVPIRAWAGPYLGTRMIDGANWLPYQEATVVTPAFPEYTSGHSTFSAAGAEILRLWTGNDRFEDSYTAIAGSSVIEAGQTPREDVVLRWATFRQAADQAGMSRRIGGIHFKDADLHGREMGRMIAKKSWAKARSYTAPEDHRSEDSEIANF